MGARMSDTDDVKLYFHVSPSGPDSSTFRTDRLLLSLLKMTDGEIMQTFPTLFHGTLLGGVPENPVHNARFLVGSLLVHIIKAVRWSEGRDQSPDWHVWFVSASTVVGPDGWGETTVEYKAPSYDCYSDYMTKEQGCETTRENYETACAASRKIFAAVAKFLTSPRFSYLAGNARLQSYGPK